MFRHTRSRTRRAALSANQSSEPQGFPSSECAFDTPAGWGVSSATDSDSCSFRRIAVRVFEETGNVEFGAGYVPDNVREARLAKHFAEAKRCINAFSRLPEGAELYIDFDAAQIALHVVSLMRNAGVPAPDNVFSHSGDAVVFGWEVSKQSAYLTVHHEGASVLKTGPSVGQYVKDYEFSSDDSLDDLVRNLSDASWKSASST